MTKTSKWRWPQGYHHWPGLAANRQLVTHTWHLAKSIMQDDDTMMFLWICPCGASHRTYIRNWSNSILGEEPPDAD